MALLDNVVVLVEDRNPDEPDLLGLYEGYALTERGWHYGGALPDRIMIYREAICDICDDRGRGGRRGRRSPSSTRSRTTSASTTTRLHDLGWG